MKPAVRLGMLALVAVLAACSSSPDRPRPANLPPPVSLIGTQQMWSAQVGAVPETVSLRAVGDRLFLVGSGGAVVLALDLASGREVWRTVLSSPVMAGVGSDGETTAVVTQENELVGITAGAVRWRQSLSASAYTPPLVAGRRVFVLTADRTVQAFDASTGQRLWSQSRSGEPLVLKQPGVLLAVGDTLVAGLAGRLVGLNPLSGSARWEIPLATVRGANEVERLVDLVGPVSRVGQSICARSYASAVGCVDASRGTLVWTQSARGVAGLGGDEQQVYGAESNGRLVAWRRTTGQQAWSTDRLLHRELSAPTLLGRAVAVGDDSGWVHLISREDGSELARLATDGSPVLSAPLLADNTLVVQTRRGGVFAWRPQ